MPTFSRNLVISTVLAVLAGAVLVLYTTKVREDANTRVEAARVLVATRDVPAGTDIQSAVEDGALTVRTLRKSDLAGGAIADPEAFAGQVVTKEMVAGDQLSTERVGTVNTQTLAFRLTGKNRAVRIPLNENAGLLGDIDAGDRVDVFTNYLDGADVVTFAAARNVLVLERNTLPSATTGTAATGSVTLQLTDEEAMKVVNALRNTTGGKENDAAVWLALAGKDATESNLPDKLVLP
jgi:Flp pilus assembly protein CpaB